MQHLLKPKQRNNLGFTFVEVVVIAPIVILAIGAFITAIVGMTADVLRSRGANELVYSVQDAINRIDEDVKLSIGFLAEDNVSAQTGQRYITTGPSTATFMTKFRNVGSTIGNVLIINALATTGNPLASTSSVAYLQNSPNACGNLQGQNTPLTYNILYYVANNALWRRVLMSPNYATVACNQNGSGTAAPWQQPSCTPGYTAYYAYCATDDEKLVDGISSSNFVITYYNSADATAANNTASDSGASVSVRNTALKSVGNVGVSINASKLIAGDTISQSSSLRSTRLDVNASTIADPIVVSTPSTPVVTGSHTAPVTTSFSWPTSTGNGTITYSLDYCIGVTATCNSSGPWTSGLNNSTATSYTVPGTGHNQIVNVRVRATNSAGTSSYGTTTLTIPLWSPFLFQNNWTNYGAAWAPSGYTKTSSGLVVLQGLIKRNSGNSVSNEIIAVLPNNYRPSGAIYLYQTIANGLNARIDIHTNGEIHVVGSFNDITLNGISFMPAGTSFTNTTPFYNGWGIYGDASYGITPSFTNVGTSRTEVRGMVAGGTNTDGTPIFYLPTLNRPPQYLHLPAQANTGNGTVGISNSDGAVQSKGNGNAWYSIHAVFVNSARASGTNCTTQWCDLTLQNGWVYLGSPYSTPQYTKTEDGMVYLKGLIRSGTTSAYTLLAQLPSGYRPRGTLLFQVQTNGALGRADVDSSGNVVFVVGYNGWFSLDGISFVAEQ